MVSGSGSVREKGGKILVEGIDVSREIDGNELFLVILSLSRA
jgi:hypothetical protein